MHRAYFTYFFRSILSLLFALLSFNSISQNYIFQIYNLENGLPQVQVPASLMDSRGYLWTGTSGGGIGRFDGISFTNFSTEHGLGSNRVLCLYEDSKGSIWAGTSEGGLNRFNGSGFDNFRYGKYINTINAIAEDNHGNLLIGTQGYGVFLFDGKNFNKYDIPEIEANININDIIVFEDEYWFAVDNYGLIKVNDDQYIHFNKNNRFPAKTPRVFYKDSKSNLWIGYENGLLLYKNNSFSSFGQDKGLKDSPVDDITEDIEGNLWLATFGSGVAIFDGNSFEHITTNEGLTLNFSQSLAADPSGGIWIGTNGAGLCRFDNKQFKIFNTYSGLKSNICLYIYEDKNKNVWLSNVGSGVAKWNGKTLEYIGRKEGLADNIVYGILEDSKGRMWFGHQTAGITMYDGKNYTVFNQSNGLAHNFANVIKEDSRGNIWISTRKGISMYDGKRFKNFTTKDGMLNDISYAIAIDQKDNVWSACMSGVLNKISTANGAYIVESFTPDIQNLNTFATLVIADNETVWVGSFGNGLFSFDGNEFKNYTTQDGLSSNQIYSVIFDDKGNLWMGHLRGLDKISFADDGTISEITFYSKEQGFIGVETALNAIEQLHDGRILISTVKGIMIYDPKHEREIVCKPKTHINSIKVFFENIDFSPYSSRLDEKSFLPKDLVLPYHLNHITFDFVGIQYASPEKVKYSWILEGFDKKWSPLVQNNTVTYTNLPAGKYRFKIRAFSPFSNNPSEPAVLEFSIKPPFYKTTLFYIMISMGGFVLIFLFVSYRIYSLRKMNQRLEQLIYARTKELQDEKENVEKQRNKILAQNIEISRKTVELEESNEELRIKTDDLEEQSVEAEQINNQLEIEQKKTDELLLNIFPLEIGNELKASGKVSVKEFERVSVMFTDFCDFINIAKEYSPIALIRKLDDNFSAFDNSIEQYRIEKIKTIGDSYMCAGGLPVPNLANPVEVVLAALDIQKYLMEQAEISKEKGKKAFFARIGIHTGSLIAGIIGKKKIAYDIWGETVNLASRMEEAGEIGKINISEATYELIKPFFETTYRGKVSLKNSPSINMYFVNRIKTEYSLDEHGFTPNDKLYAAIGEIDAS